jgi:DNA-binding HxlR family transcriptional regulator
MRSYHEFCPLTRALDVIGDRWVLLIVRELMTQGDCRYSDLRRGLPGVATSLLTLRLREMEAAGLVVRQDMPAPIGATVYSLTPRGRELSPVVAELVRWGAPLTWDALPGDTFRYHWLALPLRYLCHDRCADQARQVVRVGTLDDGCDIVADHGVLEVVPCSPDRAPDLRVTGPAADLVGLLTGHLPLEDAIAAGVHLEGDPAPLRRILPLPPTARPRLQPIS